jgi:hypothetical protein
MNLTTRQIRRTAILIVCLLGSLPPGESGKAQAFSQHYSLLSTTYRDLDGDRDGFPDTGETGRVTITFRNNSFSLTDAVFYLTSSDPDLDCLIEWSVQVPQVAADQDLTLGSLDPGQPGFTFRASDAMETVNPAAPARIDLCLNVREPQPAPRQLFCFNLLADLDLLEGTEQTFVAGPDGVFGPGPTSDDGLLFEGFDTDRNANSAISVGDAFFAKTCLGGGSRHLSLCATDADCVDPVTLVPGTCTGSQSGFYLRGSSTGSEAGTLAAIHCGGFRGPDDANPACVLDPDFPMDWHIHPCRPGSPGCPAQTIDNSATPPCVGGCSYVTPATREPTRQGGANSLHWGAHFSQTDGVTGDTTHYRQISAFVSSPINLAAVENSVPPGNTNPNQRLGMSFFHIADLMDDQGAHLTVNSAGRCYDCGQVQARVDLDPDPAVDGWGDWDVLAPFENIYDHQVMLPVVGALYCEFTPTDTGTAPPAPRGVHETMCHPSGGWSSCGSVRGTSPAAVAACDGPGVVDLGGTGVWVESRFDLDGYFGQRIQIRWIGSSWEFDPTGQYGDNGSYFEAESGGFGATLKDDGWWIDTIRVTGVVTSQTPPTPDQAPSPPNACPADLCLDADGDGFGTPGIPPCPAGSPLDCDDSDSNTFPGALEVNDGRDQQCPGEIGHGVIDEFSGDFTFTCISFPGCVESYISWYPPQEGATGYQVARSDRPDFSGGCTIFTVPCCSIQDGDLIPPDRAFFYLIRPGSPNLGSWGQDSSEVERTAICGL